jgi:hypothetical protein
MWKMITGAVRVVMARPGNVISSSKKMITMMRIMKMKIMMMMKTRTMMIISGVSVRGKITMMKIMTKKKMKTMMTIMKKMVGVHEEAMEVQEARVSTMTMMTVIAAAVAEAAVAVIMMMTMMIITVGAEEAVDLVLVHQAVVHAGDLAR